MFVQHALGGLLLTVASLAQADDLVGEIRICRTMAMYGSLDKLPIEIPAAATYTSTHEDDAHNSLFQVIVDDPVTIGPKKSDCATAKARVVHTSVPILVGRRMSAQYSIGGFNPAVKVIKDFK